MSSHAVLEIDLSALAHNYHFLKNKLLPETKLLGVVKANGYGSESVVIAQKLAQLGIDYLAVAYLAEGIKLRNSGIATPILVLHPQVEDCQKMIVHCLEPSIYSLRILKAFIEAAKAAKCSHYNVHLKTNTGLNRLGLGSQDFNEALRCVKEQKAIKIHGLLSHLAASDDLNEETFTKRQIEAFKLHIDSFEKELGPIPLKHLLNTSGILNYPEAQFQMARSGIGLYGYSNHPATDVQLKPVASLKTHISQIHHIKAGDWVGYNKGFVASKTMTIATLSVGHADGISRQYGQGKGVVHIRGKAAPIVGNVCMDMLMIDLGDIPATEGDLAIIFGEKTKNHTAEDFAKGAGTISYELLTAISSRVSRQIIE